MESDYNLLINIFKKLGVKYKLKILKDKKIIAIKVYLEDEEGFVEGHFIFNKYGDFIELV